MSETSSASTAAGGIGFAQLLTLVFIVLKLTGYIAWSWVWVLSPLWISCLIVIGILLAICAFAILVPVANLIITRIIAKVRARRAK